MNKLKPSLRSKKVHYAIRDIIAEARKLIPSEKQILPLNIGDPNKFDFRTPKHLVEAVKRNMQDFGGYAPSEGVEEAREAVAEFQKKFGLEGVDREDVLITTGGAEAINLSLNAVVNKGDNILLPRPCYPAYQAQASFLQAEVRYYDLDEKNQWQIDASKLEEQIDKKTKALVIINPNNPTGAVLSEETLRKVLLVAKKYNLMIIADEQVYPFYIYEGETKMTASLEIDVPIITIGSMSKTFLSPGWRLGWMVFYGVDSELKETIFKLKRVMLGSPHPLQNAIEPALKGSLSFLDEVKDKLVRRRDLVVDAVDNIDGLSVVKPKGAFYAFVKIDLPIDSDKKFVLDLAKDTGILCVPGEGFGQKEGTYHFRLVFLPPEEVIEQAMGKLGEFVA